MKSFIKIIFSMLLIIFVFLNVGCNEKIIEEKPSDVKDETETPVETVIYTKNLDIVNYHDIAEGEELKLSATFDQGAKVSITWKVDDDSVASISNDGVLKGIKAGSVVVTVTDELSKLTKSITIKVNAAKIALDQTVIDEFISSLPKQTISNLPNMIGSTEVTYEFNSLISEKGVITRGEENVELEGKVIIEGTAYDYKVVIVGDYIDEIAKEFISQFKNINGNIDIVKNYDEYGGTNIIWTCDSDIISKYGNFTRPFNDTYITIDYTVITKNPSSRIKYSTEILVRGEEIDYKNKAVEEWINKIVKENSVLYKDSYLPNYCDDYEATIEWFDYKGDKLVIEKYEDDPVLGKTAVFTVRVKYPNSNDYKDFTMDYRVWNKKYNNTKEKVEDFLNALHQDKIRSYVYWSQGYDEINMGYVPFYDSNNAVINKEYMCDYTYGYVRTGIMKKSTEYICVHDTAGAAPTHTALQFAQGQVQKNTDAKNKESISWHFTVGTDGIYQALPLDEVGYHAGDGSREYGTIWYNSTYGKADCIGGGNRNSIGIESCINHGSDYNDTMRILAKLVAELILQYNLSIDRIKQHWHFSGKDCPGVIRHCNRWEEFLNLVRLEYFAKTELQDVKFEWTSLVPDILDNTGHVLKSDGNQFDISYKVKYTIGDESFEKEYTSTILEQYQIKLGDWN